MPTLAQVEAIAQFSAGVVGYFDGKIETVTTVNDNVVMVWDSYNGKREEIFKPNGEQI